MALSKTEREILVHVIRRLKGDAPTTDAVHTALTGPAKLYLDTWVIGPLEFMLTEPRNRYDMETALNMVRVRP